MNCLVRKPNLRSHKLKKFAKRIAIKCHVVEALSIFDYFKFLMQSPREYRKKLDIIKRFRAIHNNVPCAHSEAELLFIANELLRIPTQLEGDIIECGTYKGGSTCKLSIVAKMTGRRMFACDLFSGLPEPKDFDARHVHFNGTVEIYRKGDWLSTPGEVQTNLEQFGESDVVELIAGNFRDTLPSLRWRKFALVFIDVDLYESIVCCLENLWPMLQPGCKFFTHEAHHLLTVQAFTDKHFWQSKFGMEPAAFIGGGTGLGMLKPYLGYVEKPAEITRR